VQVQVRIRAAVPGREEQGADGRDGLRLRSTGEHGRGAPKDGARWWRRRRRRRPVGQDAGNAGQENRAGHNTGEARFYVEEGRGGTGEWRGPGAWSEGSQDKGQRGRSPVPWAQAGMERID